MDDLIEEIDIAEIIKEAEGRIRELNAVDSFERAYFRCLIARHEMESAMHNAAEGMKRVSALMEEWRFKKWIENLGGEQRRIK